MDGERSSDTREADICMYVWVQVGKSACCATPVGWLMYMAGTRSQRDGWFLSVVTLLVVVELSGGKRKQKKRSKFWNLDGRRAPLSPGFLWIRKKK
jgi:hypothetical protein